MNIVNLPTILDVARRAGLEPRRIGRSAEHLVRCLRRDLHKNGDAHPSCRLNTDKNTFYCDPCGWGGGVVEFARELGVDFRSLKRSPKAQPRTTSKSRTSKKPDLIFRSEGPISVETQTLLAQTLNKNYRPETWAAFGVEQGVVWPENRPEAEEACVAFSQPNGGRHIFRYLSKDRKHRWRFSKGSKHDLITVGFERPDPVILAEGEWDAMTAFEAGFAVATTTGGCGTWRAEWATPFSGREEATVYDLDGPGRSGAAKPLAGLRGVAGLAVDVVLPLSASEGKDLTDFVRSRGSDALRQVVLASVERLKANRGCVCVIPHLTGHEILDAIEKRFPGTRGPLHAALAVLAYSCISGELRPCALFVSGSSSSGKSLVVRMFFPTAEHPQLESRIYRLDAFTPASFVSRAANIKADRLAEIDLLPKLTDKVLLTKELAPIFRGKDEDLNNTFAILTSVLDGDGYVVAGGSTGTRGYDKPISFCWLGATTPLSHRTWKLMATLGPRILFYDTETEEPTIEQLIECQNAESSDELEMRREVNRFLVHFFEMNPPRSVAPGAISCRRPAMRLIAVYARFIARLRAGLTLQDSDDSTRNEARYSRPAKEQEFRLVKTLNRLARASALVMGRTEVNGEDLELIRHIAFSSAPETRRQVAVALIRLTRRAARSRPGWPIDITIGEIAIESKISLPTVRHYAEELDVLKVARYSKVGVGDPSGSMLCLADDLIEMLDEQRTHNPKSFSTTPTTAKTTDGEVKNVDESRELRPESSLTTPAPVAEDAWERVLFFLGTDGVSEYALDCRSRKAVSAVGGMAYLRSLDSAGLRRVCLEFLRVWETDLDS